MHAIKDIRVHCRVAPRSDMVVVGVGVLALLGGLYAATRSPLYGVAGIATVAAVAFLCTASTAISVVSLTVAALVIPVTYLPLPRGLQILSPLLLAAVIIPLTAPRHSGRIPRWAGLTALTLVAYLALLLALNADRGLASLTLWTIAYGWAFAVGPLLLGRSLSSMAPQKMFIALASGLAVFGLVEYITQFNPYSALYESSSTPLVQKWADYRIMTALGHPLVNGMIFAVAVAGALAFFLVTGRRIWLLACALCAVAALLTGARGGLLATGVGAAFAIVVSYLRTVTRRTTGNVTRLLLVVALAGGLIFGATTGRAESDEATESTDVRTQTLALLPRLMALTHYLGSGAGTSPQVFLENAGPLSKLPLESSALQLLISVGVPGFLLLTAWLCLVAVWAVRRGAIAGPSMMVAYVVGAGSFNVLEYTPAALIFPLLIITYTITEANVADPRPRIHQGDRTRPWAINGVVKTADFPTMPAITRAAHAPRMAETRNRLDSRP